MYLLKRVFNILKETQGCRSDIKKLKEEFLDYISSITSLDKLEYFKEKLNGVIIAFTSTTGFISSVETTSWGEGVALSVDLNLYIHFITPVLVAIWVKEWKIKSSKWKSTVIKGISLGIEEILST